MNFRLWLETDDFGPQGRVGVGILPIARTTGRLLVGLRGYRVASPGTWGTWGGKADDPDLEAECRREFQEETGYTGSMQFIPAYVFRNNIYSYHNFIAILPDEFQPQLNWEHSDSRWVNLEEIQELPGLHYGLSALLKNSMNLIQQHAK